jgi:CDP-glucose 4,6-dehydratase
LVSEGYRDPLGTIASNVTGTANLLEAIRAVDSVRAVVVVATDKVYENPETGHPFFEQDPLGGHDPYSASKAAAEIVVASYRSSFFGDGHHPARIATARAGNVIGGGDWAANRLVPDCMRAFAAGEPVRLRRPDAVRPWQHVLEPLAGYLSLAARLLGDEAEQLARAWNFGPDPADDASVGDVAERVATLWGSDAQVVRGSDPQVRDAGLLRLDSSQARTELGWRPRWSLQEALEQTVSWQQAWRRGDEMQAVCLDQIAAYTRVAAL